MSNQGGAATTKNLIFSGDTLNSLPKDVHLCDIESDGLSGWPAEKTIGVVAGYGAKDVIETLLRHNLHHVIQYDSNASTFTQEAE